MRKSLFYLEKIIFVALKCLIKTFYKFANNLIEKISLEKLQFMFFDFNILSHFKNKELYDFNQ